MTEEDYSGCVVSDILDADEKRFMDSLFSKIDKDVGKYDLIGRVDKCGHGTCKYRYSFAFRNFCVCPTVLQMTEKKLKVETKDI